MDIDNEQKKVRLSFVLGWVFLIIPIVIFPNSRFMGIASGYGGVALVLVPVIFVLAGLYILCLIAVFRAKLILLSAAYILGFLVFTYDWGGVLDDVNYALFREKPKYSMNAKLYLEVENETKKFMAERGNVDEWMKASSASASEYAKNNYAEALKISLEVPPEGLYYFRKQVAIYMKLGDTAKALDMCDKLIAMRDAGWRRDKLYLLRGNIHYFMGQYQSAVDEYLQMTETSYGCGGIRHYLSLANAYAQLGRDDLAIENFEKVISFGIVDSSETFNCSYFYGYYYRAAFYFFRGEYLKMKKDLDYIIQHGYKGDVVWAEANMLMGYYVGRFERNYSFAGEYFDNVAAGFKKANYTLVEEDMWVRMMQKYLVKQNDKQWSGGEGHVLANDKLVDAVLVTNNLDLDFAALSSVPRLFYYKRVE